MFDISDTTLGLGAETTPVNRLAGVSPEADRMRILQGVHRVCCAGCREGDPACPATTDGAMFVLTLVRDAGGRVRFVSSDHWPDCTGYAGTDDDALDMMIDDDEERDARRMTLPPPTRREIAAALLEAALTVELVAHVALVRAGKAGSAATMA